MTASCQIGGDRTTFLRLGERFVRRTVLPSPSPRQHRCATARSTSTIAHPRTDQIDHSHSSLSSRYSKAGQFPTLYDLAHVMLAVGRV